MSAERVAGTRIERAADDDRTTTFLVSDLHIPDGGGAVLGRFRELVDLAAAAPRSRLVVLGDLFDAYIGPKQARVGVWHETAELLASAAAKGLSITLLHGNRDYMLDAAFARRAGCRVVAGGLRIALGGRNCLLVHGDELCERDLPYQRAKRLLRSPVTRAVLRHLPLRLALYLAARARQKSAAVIAAGDQDRFDPTARAVAEALAGDTDVLVFGHIHRPARGRFVHGGSEGEYAILPAFDEAGVYLRFAEGVLEYRAVGRDGVVEFGARAFA